MKKLLIYLKDYKKESILAPLFKMLEASFELFVPLVMAQIIDVGIKNQDASYILKMGGILVLLGLIGLACSLTAQYFAAKAACPPAAPNIAAPSQSNLHARPFARLCAPKLAFAAARKATRPAAFPAPLGF